MWWSRALVCLMVLALGPAGCGFQPIYAKPRTAESSAMATQLASIRVSGIEDRLGQQVRNNLVESLSPRGEPARPLYTLKVELSQSSGGFASSKDGNATIERLTVRAVYILSEQTSGQQVYSGQARSFTSFRYIGPRYASTAAERDSEISAASEIAASIRTALTAFFSDPNTFKKRQATIQRQQPMLPTTTDQP